LISGCLFLIPIGCIASDNAVPPDFLKGHLKIISLNEVELADGKYRRSLNRVRLVCRQDRTSSFLRRKFATWLTNDPLWD
jgi:hypothetical protein